jgi:hypothetical protein
MTDEIAEIMIPVEERPANVAIRSCWLRSAEEEKTATSFK